MSKNLNKKRQIADISNKENANQSSISEGHRKKTKLSSDGSKKDSSENVDKKKSSSSNKQNSSEDLVNSQRLTDKIDNMNISGQSNSSKQQVIIGEDLFSFYNLVMTNPSKTKEMVEEIFSHPNSSKDFVLKNLFLYFFEIMGMSEQSLLSFCCNFVVKNQNEKQLLKIFENEFEIDSDKLIFFSQEKKALLQKKYLKKIVQYSIENIVDALPQKEDYLASLINRVSSLSKCSKRIARYSFTFVGLYMFKSLLAQYNELRLVQENLQSQISNETKQKIDATKSKKQVDLLKNVQKILKDQIEHLFQQVILQRFQDSNDLIRRNMFDFLLQSLDIKEIERAQALLGKELFEVIFNSLRDQDLSIRKTGLSLIHLCLTKSTSKDFKKAFNSDIEKNKLQIFKMAIPSKDAGKQNDSTTTVKCLQVIQQMIQQNPSAYSQDHIKALSSLIHSPQFAIKEEVINLLLVLSEEFEDPSSLMEIQRVNLAKLKDGPPQINFQEEPNKSQKQIIKLIKVFESQTQTKSEYIQKLKNSEDIVSYQDQNIGGKSAMSIGEEKALLLFTSLCKKTSVIFDIQSLCELLKKEENEQRQEMIAHLVCNALGYINIMKTQSAKEFQYAFTKYWEFAISYLKLTTLNELLQTYRVNDRILEPLLKTFQLCITKLEKDNSEASDELGKDIVLLMLRIINEKELQDNNSLNESLVKLAVRSLVNLQRYFPEITHELKAITLDFHDRLKESAITKLFEDGRINMNAINFISKMNIIMSEVDLKMVTDSEYLMGTSSWAISNLTFKLMSNSAALLNLTKKQFSNLMQVPFLHLEQLIQDKKQDPAQIKFQISMVQELIDFLIEMYPKLQENEHLQVSILQTLIETLIMICSDDGKLNNTHLNFSITENEKIQTFLTQIIQSTAARVKCNDSIVQEQFNLLMTLMIRDSQVMLSQLGVDFLISFGASSDAHIMKEVRKLYIFYKQRDALIESKKSIFYSLIHKVLATLYQTSDDKILRILDSTRTEIANQMVSEKITADQMTIESYAKVKVCQNLVKNMLRAITLIVVQIKTNSAAQYSLTKQQEEQAYFKFIEDLCKYALREKQNVSLFLIIKSLMNKNFIPQQFQEKIIKGVKGIIEQFKDKLQLSEQDLKLTMDVINQMEAKSMGPAKKSKNATAIEEEKVEEPDEVVEERAPKKMSAGIDKDMIGKKRRTAPQNEAPKVDAQTKAVNKSVNVNKEKKRLKTK